MPRWLPVLLLLGSLLRPDFGIAQTVAEVQVAPVTVTLAIGEQRELLASAYDSRGDNLMAATFVWVSSNPSVVRVEADPSVPGMAVLLGVGPGIASVEARAGNQRGSAAVQVGGGPPLLAGSGVATVLQIEPGSVFLLPSEGTQLTPIFLKDDGSPAARSAVTWRSLRADVATVTREGAVVGVSPGQGVVEASTAGGLIARVTVQVAQTEFAFDANVLALSPGQADTIRAMVPDQNSRILSPRRLVWRSTNDAVVRVSPVGVATGIGAGQADIIVSGFGQESRLQAVVHRPVDVLEVLPKASAGAIGIPLGGSRSFTVKALAADETPVPEAPLAWSISDPDVASVDPSTGLVTGKSLGRARLTVRAPGKGLQVIWGIDVVAGGLKLETPVVGLLLGSEPAPLEAWFLDSNGEAVSEAAGIDWRSLDPTVVRVDAEGNVTPVAFGSAQVVASAPWGASDTATVFVQGELLITSTRNGGADLFTLNRDRPGDLHQVTHADGSELSAVYSPDGTRLAYVSDVGTDLDIYVADADGRNPVRVTTSPSQEGSPAWTPDGRHLVYESDAGGTIQVWIMAADGSDKRQLTQGDAPNIQPAVSPDGTTIAFTSTRDGNYDIYLMNLDGSAQRYFTNSPAQETQPEWLGNHALVFITETRTRKSSTRVVTRMELGRQSTVLTPEGLAVTDFAVSPSGDLLAAVVSSAGSRGTVDRRLYLIPVDGSGTPVEVPRAAPTDQLITPSFRR